MFALCFLKCLSSLRGACWFILQGSIFWGTETVALLDYMVEKKSYLQLKKFFDGQIRENLWNKKRTH